MIQKITSLIAEAPALGSDVEARGAAIALTRIVLQHVCILLAEWCVLARRSRPQGTDQPVLPLEDLRSPADGTLVSAIAELLVAAENAGWNGISKPWWTRIPSARPCCRLSRSATATLEDVLKGFVALRNDGVEGHGIPGDYDRDAELDVVALAVESFSELLPTIASNGSDLQIQTPDGGTYTLKLLRADNSDLVCYRKIQRVAAGCCSVRAQAQRSLFKREEIVYEAEDVLSASDVSTYPRYAIVASSVRNWSPFVLLPDRLTSQFTGRERELAELRDWMDDSGSRACLLYGDGGIGKTTLAIEFVHRLLEGQIRSTWVPELITFYTAKLTRWGLSGLEIIKAREVGVLDVAVAIVRGFEDQPLGREWFSREPYPLIQKVAATYQMSLVLIATRTY